jgi:hypothetical protein
VYGTSEITGVKGVNTSDECNMSKLTKKYDPYSDEIRNANKPNKKGGTAVPMEGQQPSKTTTVATFEAAVIISKQLCRRL